MVTSSIGKSEHSLGFLLFVEGVCVLNFNLPGFDLLLENANNYAHDNLIKKKFHFVSMAIVGDLFLLPFKRLRWMSRTAGG